MIKSEEKKDRRVEKTRNAIRNAYLDLLLEKGSRLSVTAIAERANIDRKTFYFHYDSMDDVFDDLISVSFSHLNDNLAKIGFYENPTDIAMLLKVLNRMIEENLTVYRHLSGDPKYNTLIDHIAFVITEAMIKRYQSNVPDSEPYKVYCHYFIYGVMSVYQSWLQGNVNMSLDQLAEYTAHIAVNGLQSIPNL